MARLLDEIEVIEVLGDADPSAVEVSAIEHDSRLVAPGALFCCLPGMTTDGHDRAPEAVARGAVGIICEHFPVPATDDLIQARVAVGGARPAMARLAAAYQGFPSRDLVVAGVTGTNGKTTVAHLLASIFEHSGLVTTVIGTLSGVRTTPESNDLQAILAKARDEQVSSGKPNAVAMEVSSHSLVQSRVDAIHFDVVAFTNLSHEHLDFHGDMEEYWRAKASLFVPERAVRGVVNADDEWGRRLLASSKIPVQDVRSADATNVELRLGRSIFTWRRQVVELALSGRFNVTNALVSAESALALGIDPGTIAAGLTEASSVRGRFEVVVAAGSALPFSVVIDYAHTPYGLETVLEEARGLQSGEGRLLVVFGCGGNRDRAKRPLMGKIAARFADITILTSDNPRDEDPLGIIEEIRAGVGPDSGSTGRVLVEPDRRAAIELAISEARERDVLVIAGKGHETTQEIAGEYLPFDDRLVTSEVLGCSL